jgi:hypothetical protein
MERVNANEINRSFFRNNAKVTSVALFHLMILPQFRGVSFIIGMIASVCFDQKFRMNTVSELCHRM